MIRGRKNVRLKVAAYGCPYSAHFFLTTFNGYHRPRVNAIHVCLYSYFLRSTLLVSVQTGQHEPEDRRYYRSLGIQLAHPTDDTHILVQAALAGLDPIYREGYAYSK